MEVTGATAQSLAVVVPLLIRVANTVAVAPKVTERLPGSTAASRLTAAAPNGSNRRIRLVAFSASQIAPSGPTVICRTESARSVSGNLVADPATVSRHRLPPASVSSKNHKSPSGPASIDSNAPEAPAIGISVTVPAVVTRPMAPSARYHRFASGPAVIAPAPLKVPAD